MTSLDIKVQDFLQKKLYAKSNLLKKLQNFPTPLFMETYHFPSSKEKMMALLVYFFKKLLFLADFLFFGRINLKANLQRS